MILPPTSCSIAAEGYSRQALAALIVETGAATCRTSRSVVLGRGPEYQPLELADGPSAQAQSGLEALLAELARVEAAAQLVQRGSVLFLDLVARGLDQDDVARPAVRGREADPALALLGVEPLRRDHHGLPRLEALQGGLLEELVGRVVDLVLGHAALEQPVHLVEREHGGLGLDQALDEAVARLLRRGDHHQHASGRVAEQVGRGQDAAAGGHVGLAWGAATGARAVGRPAGPLVCVDLDAARVRRSWHPIRMPHGVREPSRTP